MNLEFNAIQKTKLAGLAIVLAATTLAPQTASAALVSGTATIALNGTWNSSFLASGWAPTTYFDSSFNNTMITGTLAGGTAISGYTGVFEAPINTNTSTIVIGGFGTAGTIQATTMDTSNSSVGVIGLSGAFRFTAPSLTTYLSSEDWTLQKIGGTWNLVDHSPGFPDNTLFQLVNVVDNLATTGMLDGDLQFLPDPAHQAGGFSYSGFLGASGAQLSTTLGHLSIAPVAAVPLPAAAWLFGGALLSLFGVNRRKNSVAA